MGKLTDLIKKGFTNISNTTKRNIVINSNNGKTTIKLNGKTVDPSSKEGKALLKEVDNVEKELTRMAKDMSEAFEKAFDGFGDNFGEGL